MKKKIPGSIAAMLLLLSLTACSQGISTSIKDISNIKNKITSEQSSDAKVEVTDSAEEKTTNTATESTDKTTVSKATAKKEGNATESLDNYLHLMPDVSPDMLSADYWTDKLEDADQLILDEDQIQTLNTDLLFSKAEQNKFLKLSGKNDIIDGDTLRSYLDESEALSDSYFKDGSAISQSYWDNLIDNENYSAIEDEHKVSYGFAVERAEVTQFPTTDVITTDEEYTFFNENMVSTILYAEPVIIAHESKDEDFYFIISQSFTGWIEKTAVALSPDKDAWDEYRNSDQFLMVTSDECSLEYDPVNENISEKELTMGCKLPLLPYDECVTSEEGRSAYGNYVVKIPCRKDDGKIEWDYAYVPYSRGVNVGYLPYTISNVLELACSEIGDRYGWGGQYHARDCSQYIMEIYRCFGFNLPRNSTGLNLMNVKTIDVSGYSDSEKEDALKDTPPGSILYLKGHVMIYLGEDHGNYYVISSSASSIPEDDKIVNVHSIVVNTLNIKRKDGNTWLEHLESYKIIK